MKKTLLLAALLASTSALASQTEVPCSTSTTIPTPKSEKVLSATMFSTGLFAGCFKNQVSVKNKNDLAKVDAVWTSCSMQAATFMLDALPELGPVMIGSYLQMLRGMADDYTKELGS